MHLFLRFFQTLLFYVKEVPQKKVKVVDDSHGNEYLRGDRKEEGKYEPSQGFQVIGLPQASSISSKFLRYGNWWCNWLNTFNFVKILTAIRELKGLPGLLFLIFLLSPTTFPLTAQDPICAEVRIEIEQELTFERQAFDARMRINNGYENLAIENVHIEVYFTDADENPVVASSDPNHPSALFYIRVDGMTDISNISGIGRVEPNSTAAIDWLIIPTPGAGGQTDQGRMFFVGANLSYTLGQETFDFQVIPDTIFVKPMPNLALDYFLPKDVYGDEPLTTQIEPSQPFPLAVRVRNTGYGVARNVKIDSGQPKIVDNEQGLLVGFQIDHSQVDGKPASDALLLNFGDIQPGTSGVGRWTMSASLSGRFVSFGASFSHRDELGGRLTSLIDYVDTHTLIREVLVDLPGRDQRADFLATNNDGNVTRIYETQNEDTLVQDLSGTSVLEGSGQVYTVTHPPASGFVYMRFIDPKSGQGRLSEVVRGDGKQILPQNAWLSQTWDKIGQKWHFWVSIFDVNPLAQGYTIAYGASAQGGNLPPVIAFVADKSVEVEQYLGFLVQSTDPNGPLPILSTGPMPLGAVFENIGNGFSRFSWTPQLGQVGIYQISFTATDGELSSSRSVKITVSADPVNNQAPVSLDGTLALNEDTVTIGTLVADDPEGNAILFSLVTPPNLGAVEILDPATGSFRYTPNPNVNGNDAFSFKANDGQLDSNLGSIQIAINPVNDPPSLVSATIETVLNTASTGVTPLVVDPDQDDSFTFAITGQGQDGTASVGDGQLIYTPNLNFVGLDSFEFSATDSGGASVTGTAQVTVTEPPIDFLAVSLTPDFLSGDLVGASLTIHHSGFLERTDIRLDLLYEGCAVNHVIESRSLTLQPGDNAIAFVIDPIVLPSLTSPALLTAVIDAGSVEDEINENNNRIRTSLLPDGQAPLELGVSSSFAHSGFYCVDGPGYWSGRAFYQLAESGMCHQTPLSGAILNYNLVRTADSSVVTSGSVRCDSNGFWHVSENLPDEAGTDLELRLNLSDSEIAGDLVVPFGLVDCANNGLPVLSPPYPGPDAGMVTVTIADAQAQDPWLVHPGMPIPTLSSGQIGGTTGNGDASGLIIGSPMLGATGGASPGMDAAVVVPQFSPLAPRSGEWVTLQSTISADDSYYGMPVTWTLTDLDGNNVQIAETTRYYLNGDLQVSASFKPHLDGAYTVTVTLGPSYTDADPNNDSAQVLMDVLPQNQAPLAADLTLNTLEDIALQLTLTGSDPDGDALTYELLSAASIGVASIVDAQTGEVTYTPNPNEFGQDSFTYRVGDGVAFSEPASVTINIGPVNDAPVAQSGTFNTDEDLPVSGILVATDTEGAQLNFSITSQGTLGVVTLNDSATGAFTYTPNAEESGSDSFTFVANDGELDSQPATITVSINSQNDLPVALNQSLGVDEDLLLSGTLAATDAENDTLAFAIISHPVSGTVTLVNVATGTFEYQPDPDFFGADSFTFSANDGQGDSNTATVSITVNPVNDAPTALASSYLTNQDQSVSGILSATDVENSSLTFSIGTQGTLGVATLDNAQTGAFTYTPNAGVTGIDNFTFSVNDGELNSNPATITVSIGVVNQSPVVVHPIPDQNAQLSTVFSYVLPADSFSDPDPGDSLTWTLTGDVPTWLAFDGNSRSLSGTPDALGSHTLAVTVTDLGGLPASDTFLLTVENTAFAEIHGFKFEDLNGNGTWDSGEPGLPDWTFYLDNNRNGIVDSGETTVLTDSQGDYSLADLVAGRYTVDVVQQPGWQRTYDSQALFAAPEVMALGTPPTSLVSGDFNGDGMPDLATTTAAGQLLVYLSQTEDGFASAVTYAIGSDAVALITYDLSGDDALDLVTVDRNSGSISVLMGIGNGSFSTASAYVVGQQPVSVAVVDWDGDGLADLAISDALGGVIVRLRNTGAGFETLSSLSVGGTPEQVLAVALDSHPGPDLVVAESGGQLVVFKSADGFATPTTYPLTPVPLALAIADFNGDGHLDVAAAGDGTLAVLDGLGEASFASETLYSLTGIATAMVAFDADKDNDMDIVLGYSGSTDIVLLPNANHAGFGESSVFDAAGTSTSLTAVDLDADRDVDLVVANNNMVLLHNQLIQTIQVSAGEIITNVDFSSQRLAAPLVVNSTLDAPDQNPGDGSADDGTGQATLRAAVMEANALIGQNTIVLGQGTYQLSVVGALEDGAGTGDFDIVGDLVLSGDGADVTIIDGMGLDRIFHILPGATVQLSGISIRGGVADHGGAIRNEGNLILSNASLESNTANQQGGALWSQGTFTVDSSTLADNHAIDGGAVFSSGTAILKNSTVSGNQAVNEAGGILNAGQMTVTQSTVANNQATTGGGISNSSSMTLGNTLVAENSAGTDTDLMGSFITAGHNLIGLRGSAQGVSDGVMGDQVGEQQAIEPMLNGLAQNGGPTRTHALAPGSPAIDAGDNHLAPFQDQRGLPRLADGDGDGLAVVDIGAYETDQTGLQVLSPNGGENLIIGEIATLTWASTGVEGNVRLELSRDGGSTWVAITDNTANDGSHTWSVTGPSTNQALLRVTSRIDGTVKDASDGFFVIPEPVMTVLTPNGGENLTVGSTATLTWSSANIAGKVRLDMSRDGGLTWTVITDNRPNDGSHIWSVTGPSTNQALLRVTSRIDGTVKDASDGVFSIPEPMMTVHTPNGGESLLIGSTATFTWSSANIDGKVRLDMSRDGGLTWTAITDNTPNDGSHTWSVTGPSTNQALLKVTSRMDGTVSDASDGMFVIPEPEIIVLAPNGGESLIVGSMATLTWGSSGFKGNVGIDLSRDGGVTWDVVNDNTPNDGSHSWTVTDPITDQGLIRVASRLDTAINDKSDSYFRVVQPLTVFSPNGGESLIIGSATTVAWSTASLEGSVRLDLSRDGGATWVAITDNTPNDGSHTWSVIGPQTDQGLLRITSNTNANFSDTSDNVFLIPEPEITVLAPNGGEILILGSTSTLAWSASGFAGNVRLDLSRDGGATWVAITDNTPNDGSHTWSVSGPSTNQALLRVTSRIDGTVKDASDGVFSIPEPMMMVLSPNGGESLLIGSAATFTWSSANIDGKVRLDMSRDGGLTWAAITDNTPNDGSHTWSVTGPSTNQALLKVTSRLDGTVSDISDGVFSIPEPVMTVLSPNGGESLLIGSTATFTWSSANIDGNVRLDISRDGGLNWVAITDNTANDGVHTWSVTGPSTKQGLLKVTSRLDGTVSDISDVTFNVLSN